MNFFRNLFGRKVRIVTHDGRFHADDVFAVAVLQIYFERQGQKIEIVRSRRPEIIATGDIVVDNGRIYDPTKKIFDHHQTGGAGKRENGVPYAAFGLIWKHYGPEICDSIEVADLLDIEIVQPIDARDTGYESFESTKGVRVFLVDDIINIFNPNNKEKKPEDDAILEYFIRAVEFAESILKRTLIRARLEVADWKIAEETYRDTKDKRIIVFDKPISWSRVLCAKPEPIYIVHPKYGTDWAVRAVPIAPGLFGNRKRFPVEWGGKTELELETLTGVSGVTFCHMAGFLCNVKTKESAIELATKALTVDSAS